MIPWCCNNHPGNEAQIGLGRGQASILTNNVCKKLFQNKILRHKAKKFKIYFTGGLLDKIS